jgi:hypothetical protein
MSRLILRDGTLAEALASTRDVARAAGASAPRDGKGWPLARAVTHAARGIEYSLTGYPVAKPAWFRATVGRIALGKFLRQGYMRHDLAAVIPGEPEAGDGGGLSLDAAIGRLEGAIMRFHAHSGELAPHFAYGPVGRGDYERIHAMHLADHLGAFGAG